eukprot:scaffold39074_cov123-Skeletonema_marinoi.AAC.2
MAPTEYDKTPDNTSTPVARHPPEVTQDTTRQSSRAAAAGRTNSAAGSAAALFLSPSNTQESQGGQKRQRQEAVHGTPLRQAQQQAKRPRTQQRSQQEEQQQEQHEEEEEGKDDDTAVESGDREGEVGDNYEEESDEDFLIFIDECYGKTCTPEQLKELKRKLDRDDLEYWRDNFSTSSKSRYDLRWLIKHTDFFTISEGETDKRTCHDLVVGDVEVLNQQRGIYVAMDPGGDPNLTHDTAAVRQPLYKRLSTLLQFTTQHNKVKFKFFATKDLCGEKVKLLEKLIKFSLFADSLYSDCGEVYYGNTQIINVLLRQADIFARRGKFSYKDRAGVVITSSNYEKHPKYQEYRCATNRNARRSDL